MRRMPWTTYLWPGLPQLWDRGSGAGLILATGFAALVNLLLLASFVWQELLSPWHLRLGWLATSLLWLGSAVLSGWYARREPAQRGPVSAEALFREALSEYLQESWFEVERILGRLLHFYPRDVEGRLLLATSLRHSGRYREALEEIGRLELLRDAEAWAWEIAAEKRLLAEEQAERPTADAIAAHDYPSSDVSQQAA